MASTQSRTKAKKPAAPPERVKGEIVKPENTMLLIQRLGITRAHRELGVSTTTLHKARRSGVVSKVVEIAATAALSGLGATASAPQRAAGPQPFTTTAAQERMTDSTRVMFLVSVDRAKAAAFEKFARAMDAEIMSA